MASPGLPAYRLPSLFLLARHRSTKKSGRRTALKKEQIVLIRALVFTRMQKWEALACGSNATTANRASRERPPDYHAPGP